MSTPFYRPQRLLPITTFVWKTVNNIPISADVFVTAPKSTTNVHPVMLFIHGGGWIGGDRTDYSVALFSEFLKRGFVVVSMDYRLLPETPLVSGQLEDIRDMEDWLRQELPLEIKKLGYNVSTNNLVVTGASAGAHLALLTPNLWKRSPTAILSMYGPTKMYDLPYRKVGPFSSMEIPPLTPETLRLVMVNPPPSGIPPPQSAADFLSARSLIGLHVFRQEITAEFLLRGVDEGKLPTKGSVARWEIDEISPLALCRKSKWPPTYQILGTADEIFAVDQVEDFDVELRNQGVPCKTVVLDGMNHAFDIAAEIGSDVHNNVINPAVDWIIQFLG